MEKEIRSETFVGVGLSVIEQVVLQLPVLLPCCPYIILSKKRNMRMEMEEGKRKRGGGEEKRKGRGDKRREGENGRVEKRTGQGTEKSRGEGEGTEEEEGATELPNEHDFQLLPMYELEVYIGFALSLYYNISF